jgi:hypothetical protein
MRGDFSDYQVPAFLVTKLQLGNASEEALASHNPGGSWKLSGLALPSWSLVTSRRAGAMTNDQ